MAIAMLVVAVYLDRLSFPGARDSPCHVGIDVGYTEVKGSGQNNKLIGFVRAGDVVLESVTVT